MKTILSDRPAATLVSTTDTPSVRSPLQAQLLDRARFVRQAYLQLFGIPDYERYVAHMASHHQGEPVLSRREFCANAIDRKYDPSDPRCC
jgi:uncharacterized short protein YbdD (DUF466 family)